MPTYEYICKNCGYEFENFHSMSAEPIKICPECGKNEVIRKISGGTGIIFKGTGFYQTDYVNKQQQKKTNTNNEHTGSCNSGCCKK